MQGFPISRSPASPVTSVRTRTMATPQVQRTMVVQPVNLRPLGNTVSMSVPADNPFTGGRRVSITTQASGGMAHADPSQRTRSSFLPIGLGDLGAAPVVSYDTVFNWYAQFDADGKAGKPITPAKEAYWRQQAQADADKKAASGANWSKIGDIFTTTVGAASNIASDLNKNKQLELQRQIAEANARQAEIEKAKDQAFWGRATDVSQYGAGMMARKEITIPLLIIGGGALAVALFLVLKKKRSAA